MIPHTYGVSFSPKYYLLVSGTTIRKACSGTESHLTRTWYPAGRSLERLHGELVDLGDEGPDDRSRG
jgi:hypothetical protein